jgi:hypothetical protein
LKESLVVVEHTKEEYRSEQPRLWMVSFGSVLTWWSTEAVVEGAYFWLLTLASESVVPVLALDATVVDTTLPSSLVQSRLIC